MSRQVRVAAAQWPIEHLPSHGAWRAKLDAWLGRAAAAGAQLAVVPEYASMELTALLGIGVATELPEQLHALQPMLPAYREAYAEAARRLGIVVVAGSFPEQVGDRFINRARVFGPQGAEVAIDKLQMTRFEAEQWGVAPGHGQVVLEASWGRFGVAICYDSEFPLLVRRMAEAGARVILVPSCTDTMAGYWRVRVACQARALENQCYVVHAPTVGFAPWSPAVDENHGAAAVYAPPDRGFPDDGVVALGELDQPGLLIARLDLDAIERVRTDGQVLGHRDWDLPGHQLGRLTRSKLA